MDRGRIATLVVVDRGGAVRGATKPVQVALPWWQESGPIVDALAGDAVVLRLLDAAPDRDQPMGGRVTYLVECEAELDLEPWHGRLEPHRLRHPWAEPGGPATDLEWVASVVDITGPARQHRTWNLSAIWSIPTTGGTVWLKCVPPFLAHEAALLEVLAGKAVPRLIAADGHRLLLAGLPGEDGYDASDAEQVEMITALVGLQLGAADHVETLVARGVPDLRADRLSGELSALVGRLAPESRRLARLVAELPDRLAAAAGHGLPDTVVHGDPHGGNCRRGVHPPIWFDWGDSFVGSPLLDVAALHRMRKPALERWLDLWAGIVPGSDPRSAWHELQPVAMLRMAWVYQRFLDNIEPSEHVYHRDDVARCLAETEAALDLS
jgi:hypothetical protein